MDGHAKPMQMLAADYGADRGQSTRREQLMGKQKRSRSFHADQVQSPFHQREGHI